LAARFEPLTLGYEAIVLPHARNIFSGARIKPKILTITEKKWHQQRKKLDPGSHLEVEVEFGEFHQK